MRHKTYSQRKEDAVRNWRVMDAEGKVLGRLATQIAIILRGKDKPTFTPHIDGGDFVVVVNADKVVLTRNKLNTKIYAHFTGYRGGLKTRPAKEMLEKDPEEMIRLAVWGMLPKGPLGRDIIKKLQIYKGPSHPHAAQKPTAA
ncbi:MAG: 50S ribosomal protein L13 [Pseudomonadota bacterium]